MRIDPVPNFKSASELTFLISSKRKSEQITASGTTALLKAARVPVFD
jgi:hypothetical protein